MKNGCWGVASGGIGHQRSFNVTTQGHLKKSVIYLKTFTSFVFRNIGKVTYPGPWEMGTEVSAVVE